MRPAHLGALCAAAFLMGCDTSYLHNAEVGDLVLSVVADEIRLATVKGYPCSNYPLVVDADVSTQGAWIEVEGVGEVEGCRTGIGPAIVAVPMSEGSTTVGYEVTVEKGGRTDWFEYTCGFAGCFLVAVGEPEFTRIRP